MNSMKIQTGKDGCYDIDGKCVNCGGYHPCSCEANVVWEVQQSQEGIIREAEWGND
jgi:hypothetical protein